MSNFDKALHDPQSVYEYPSDVMKAPELNDEQKIRILQQWEHDAKELLIAEEENMTSDSSSASTLLSQIKQLLRELGVHSDTTE